MSADAPPPAVSSDTPVAIPPSERRTAYDPAWYTWSRFFSILSGTSTNSEALQYVHAKSLENEEADCARCEKHRDWLLAYSPVVRFLTRSIEKVGGNIDEKSIACRRCNTFSSRGPSAGTFAKEYGILLCANHFKDKGHQEDVMTHELVHAYDHLRFKVDPENLRHVACTEIRATMLSGECRWVREFFGRFDTRFTSHFQDCVRERAASSVRMHQYCKDDAHALKVVNDVWGSCFADTRPFDEIYR